MAAHRRVQVKAAAAPVQKLNRNQRKIYLKPLYTGNCFSICESQPVTRIVRPNLDNAGLCSGVRIMETLQPCRILVKAQVLGLRWRSFNAALKVCRNHFRLCLGILLDTKYRIVPWESPRTVDPTTS